jgi:hypothetical protein
MTTAVRQRGLAGLVEQVPASWTRADRHRFLLAFIRVLDYSTEIRDPDELDGTDYLDPDLDQPPGPE